MWSKLAPGEAAIGANRLQADPSEVVHRHEGAPAAAPASAACQMQQEQLSKCMQSATDASSQCQFYLDSLKAPPPGDVKVGARDLVKELLNQLLHDEEMAKTVGAWTYRLLVSLQVDIGALFVRILQQEQVLEAVNRLADQLVEYLCASQRIQERVGGLLVDAICLQSSREAAALWACDLVDREDVTAGFRDLVVTTLQMDEVTVGAQALTKQVVDRVLNDPAVIGEARRALNETLRDGEVRATAKGSRWRDCDLRRPQAGVCRELTETISDQRESAEIDALARAMPSPMPAGGRPSPARFHELLEQLRATHSCEVAYLERTISRLRLQRGDAAALEDDICGQRDGFGNIQREDSSVCEVTAPEEPRELDVRQEAADDDIDLDEAPARNVCSVHASSSAPPAWGGAKSLMISKEEKAEEEQEENDKQEDENAASSRPSECIPKFADAHEFDADEFGSPSEDQQGRELGRGQYVWQWQRAKGNFCSYAPAVNARIEDAYRRGYSKVRVKSGKGGQVPMEIFFVDTAQLDPKSRNLRKLRRLGRKSWQVELTRHAKAVARSVLWGEPRGESVKMYGMRQSSLLRRTGINVHSRTSERSGSFFEKADNVCSRIVRSTVYATVSLFVMLLNVVWIGISADLFDRDGKHLFHPDRHWLSPTVECIFMVYFLAELIVEITSMKYKWKWYRNPDLRVDAVCTITIMLEVLVVPWTGIPTPALQSLRLIKLARLVKLTRKSKDAAIVLRGLFSGMRSAAVIWLLIAVLLYTYSVLLTTATTDPVLRDKYFGSVGQTVATLITHGIAHDGVADFIYDLRMNHGFIQALVVATFVFVAYFGLLNIKLPAANPASVPAQREGGLGYDSILFSALFEVMRL
ncbi:unnamed protein product [Prorocentrum cordatum]|uniref:WWE domain-containing protein n=1 Tax=Prorocentrum cordatum TaxID=2364126 RepID=A0ABN9S250_9DINO|nr:unnamed protein product [Polarella glacialis]